LVGIYIGKIFSINYLDIKKINNNYYNSNDYEKKERKKDQKKDNYLIELIYIFNPISIFSSVAMQLRIFYNFFFFYLILNFDIDCENDKNTGFFKIMFTSLISITNIIFCPAYAFLILFYYLRNFYIATIKQKIKIIFIFIISLIICGLLLHTFFEIKEFNGILAQYSNYFFVSDTLPNFGLMWNLFPEVIRILNYFVLKFYLYK